MACGCKKGQVNARKAPTARAGHAIIYFTGTRPGGQIYFAPGTSRYLLGANPQSYYVSARSEDVAALKAKYGKELLVGPTDLLVDLLKETTENQDWLAGSATLFQWGYRTLGEVVAEDISVLQPILGDQTYVAVNAAREKLGMAELAVPELA